MIPRVALVPKRFKLFFALPLLRRAGFHFKRMTSGMDGAFFARVGIALVGFLLFTATVLTLAERNTPGRTWHKVGGFFRELGDWVYWSLTTSFGAGASSAVETAIGPVTPSAERKSAIQVAKRPDAAPVASRLCSSGSSSTMPRPSSSASSSISANTR